MTHEEIRDKLYELYDGEAEPAQAAEIEGHLEACAECRQARERWARLARALLRGQPPRASEAFTDGVLARLDELEPPVPEWLWRVPVLGLGFAAALFILVLAGRDEEVSAEALLLAGQNGAAVWLVQPGLPGPEELMGVSVEAR